MIEVDWSKFSDPRDEQNLRELFIMFDKFEVRPEDILRDTLVKVQELNELLPCFENEQVIYHIKKAIHWEEIRNEKRIAQKVKGTNQRHKS